MPNFTISFQAMGSHIQAWLNVPTQDEAQVLEEVPGWFELWEVIFSRFIPTSELCRLNDRAGTPVRVSAPMFEVVSAAMQASAATDGLFNPLILPALEAAGYDHSFDPATFTPGERPRADGVPDWHQIELDAEHLTIGLAPGTRLDLGGIVKGWAAQRTAERLSSLGPCLVDAGGDLVARGTPDESGGWYIVIPEPGTANALRTILLTDAAVATSGTDYRHWTGSDGRQLHHLIDPRTGQPAQSDIVSATVVAPDAIGAEVWAKVSLISGRLPNLPALLVENDGRVIVNTEFEGLCKAANHLK